ncbi:MAG: hypothetical protein WBF53_11010 [Litorimonas sp.]
MPSLSFLLLTFATVPAWAQDVDTPRTLPAEDCFPVEEIKKSLSKFDSLKASKRDTVAAELSLEIALEEGEAMPERYELRDGERVLTVLFDDRNRSVELTDQLRDVSDAAVMCNVDPAREGRLVSERGYGLAFGMGVRFIETPGFHTLEDIEKGLKDGRSHYKKIVGAMGFMVPKFDYIAVAGHDEDKPPRVIAMLAGSDIGEPAFELFNGGRMVEIDTLEEMGADGIRIDADYYRMNPSPSIETVKRFMGGDEEG